MLTPSSHSKATTQQKTCQTTGKTKKTQKNTIDQIYDKKTKARAIELRRVEEQRAFHHLQQQLRADRERYTRIHKNTHTHIHIHMQRHQPCKSTHNHTRALTPIHTQKQSTHTSIRSKTVTQKIFSACIKQKQNQNHSLFHSCISCAQPQNGLRRLCDQVSVSFG